MKTRWKILIAVGIFMVLSCAISLLTVHVGPVNKLEAYKKFLRDKGEKLEISEVAPPPVPAESNCADAVSMAFGLVGTGDLHAPGAMRMVAPGKAMVGWMQPDARNSDFTNTWDVFAADAETNRPATKLLRQILDRPKLDFYYDYKMGFALPLPQLAPLKHSAQVLSAEASLDLHDGDPGGAATNVCALLTLVRADGGPFIVSHLVRVAMTGIAVGATWEVLQATNATDAPLAALQQNWERLDFFGSAAETVSMERAMMGEAIEKARASNAEFDRIFGVYSSMSGSPSSAPGWPADLDELKKAGGKFMWRTSWSYSEELHMLQADQIVLDMLRMMKTNQPSKAQCDCMNAQLAANGLTNAGEAFFQALKIPDFRDIVSADFLGSTITKTLRIEAARRVVVTAVALKRFQLKHGRRPDTLEELAPEFFPAVPLDPYDGKPLKYHVDPDGTYLLYCVGADGVDDGGDGALPPGYRSANLFWQNDKARDWVWPQPATAAEIQFFYDHPPK